MTDREPAVDVRELFRLLGNETRMRIMRVLWAEFEFEYYVTESREPTSFGTIREQADVADSGNFNYHLGELTGTLVDDVEDGYVLTPLGYNLMRAIDRYADFEYDTIDEWAVSDPCPFCDGTLAATYRREVLEVRCRDCAGLGADGNFTFVELSSIGAQYLEREQLLDAAILALSSKVRSSMWGVCWDCNAPMETTLVLCDDHDPGSGGTCSNCENRYRTRVRASCPTCGTSGFGPIAEYAIVTDAVGAFFETADRGPSSVGPWQYRLTALEATTERVTGTEPATTEITFAFREDTCRATVESGSPGITVTTTRP
jgi:DNA-binding transcriptional ArsR family regulator